MVVRIAGVTIPNDKRIEVALTYIFGIGPNRSVKILDKVGIDLNIRTKDLNEDQINGLRNIVEKEYKVEGDLKREIFSNIKRLKEIGSYRGSRHTKNLTVRGQRRR